MTLSQPSSRHIKHFSLRLEAKCHERKLVSPVTHTLGAHGATVGPADVLLGLGEPHQNLRSNSPDLQGRTIMSRTDNVS